MAKKLVILSVSNVINFNTISSYLVKNKLNVILVIDFGVC